jgi:hypothetical protein
MWITSTGNGTKVPEGLASCERHYQLSYDTIGVDTEEDLARAEAMLRAEQP